MRDLLIRVVKQEISLILNLLLTQVFPFVGDQLSHDLGGGVVPIPGDG